MLRFIGKVIWNAIWKLAFFIAYLVLVPRLLAPILGLLTAYGITVVAGGFLFGLYLHVTRCA